MYKEYCTGCGLCSDLYGVKMEADDKGFNRISNEKEYESLLKDICPCGGKQCNQMEFGEIWGKVTSSYLSYSKDENIRHSASSGGVLTSLCIYLLDEKLVDGIIQIKEDNVIGTKVVCSKTSEEVIDCCGSRYSSSMPLSDIKKYVETGKKYAVVAKPCDITALKNYMQTEKSFKETFTYLLAFFCAGAPSVNANIQLLNKMNATLEESVSLKYRGDGWPGYATVKKANGEEGKISYREAWRDTLGRDIRLGCRFCLDGIGEMADISACDAWYLDENDEPIFDEGKGRNAVLCRNEKGQALFEAAYGAGYISKEEYPNFKNEIAKYQKYQYQRKVSMLDLSLAMKCAFKSVPNYDKKLLKSYAQKGKAKFRIKRFLGTYKRILNGKI